MFAWSTKFSTAVIPPGTSASLLGCAGALPTGSAVAPASLARRTRT
jgi:hypothetical protein